VMDQRWKNVFPDELSTVSYMQADKIESAEVNTNIRKLFVFLGMVAIILSAIGLFSMVSLNINRRLKEIGIRKVLGASTAHLAQRISREFVIILILASIIGAMGGFYLSEMLMASIWAYYVPVKVSVLLLSIAVLFFTAMITIGGKVLKTSSRIPARVLRE
jgi:putative ABC transport system permease protein